MLIRRFFLTLGTLLFLALGLRSQPGYAQPGGTNMCSPLVEQALGALGSNCEGLGRNSACYGSFRISASFTDPQAQAAFSAPAAQVSIDTLQSIRTFPLNTAANEWGIAVINTQANLPGFLPGQNAVFLLIGDAEVENAVPQEEAFHSGEALTLRTQIGANLYAQPSISADVVDEIPAGAEILTDAVSEDGAWLRTAYDESVGWVSRQVVAAEADLSVLPVYTPTSLTTMQAFYFRTNIGAECRQAPDAVVVQGPRGMTIDLNANGVDIRLGSSVLFRTLPLDETAQEILSEQTIPETVTNLFQIIVLDGMAILYPDSDHPIYIPAGYTTSACLSEPQNLGIDGAANDYIVLADCGFTRPRPLSPAEWSELAALNGITLNYPLDITDFLGEICQPREDWFFTYRVRPNDTMTSIAALYGISVDELAQGNCIDNPDILYVGEVLRVPSEQQPPPPPPAPLPDQPPAQPTAVPPTGVPPTATPTPVPCPIPSPIPAGDTTALIAAISAANDEALCPGANTLNLSAGAYLVTAANDTTDGPNGLPSVTTAIAIAGNSASIERMAGDNFRLFHVAASGSLSINGLTIRGGDPGAGQSGGAIFNAGSLALSGVTITESSADFGGGIANTAGNLNLINSTISGNFALEDGGALSIGGGAAAIQFTTILNNFSEIGVGGVAFTGGSTTVKNSVIANNSPGSCGGSAFTSQGANFSDDEGCIGFTITPFLSFTPLQNNGGPTPTHLSLSGNPNLDAATDCTLIDGTPLGADQRGIGRPTDDNFDTVPVCDSGSTEGFDGAAA